MSSNAKYLQLFSVSRKKEGDSREDVPTSHLSLAVFEEGGDVGAPARGLLTLAYNLSRWSSPGPGTGSPPGLP